MKTFIRLDSYQVNIRGSTGALTVGKPGSGKSVLVSYLMLKLMSVGALPLIADTKRSDFYSLRKVLKLPNTCAKLKHNSSEGLYLSFSIRLIVCLATPILLASSICEILRYSLT